MIPKPVPGRALESKAELRLPDKGASRKVKAFRDTASFLEKPIGAASGRASRCLGKLSHRVLSYTGAQRGFLRQNEPVRHLGYTRVSTAGQDAKLQLDALVGAGVQKRDVFADVTSGSRTAIERPGMKKLLDYVEPGDTVVVWRIDRLGRSLIDVLNTGPTAIAQQLVAQLDRPAKLRRTWSCTEGF